MFEPKLSRMTLSCSLFDKLADEDELKFDKNGKITIIREFIKKSFIDNNYTDIDSINNISENVIDILTKFEFDSIVCDIGGRVLDYYDINILNKLLTLNMKCYSFNTAIIIQIGFIYGVKDQVLIRVDKQLNGIDESDIDEAKLTSLKGKIQSMSNPLNQSNPFINEIYIVEYGELMNNCNIKIDYPNIQDLFFKKSALTKYSYMDKDLQEKYLDSNGDFNYRNIIYNDDDVDDTHFDVDGIQSSMDYYNPVFNVLFQFNTIDNRMIDIKDLDELISEILIDSYLIDSYDLRYFINNGAASKSCIEPDILEKIDQLIYKSYNYMCGIIDEVSKLDVDSYYNSKNDSTFTDTKYLVYDLTFDKLMQVIENRNSDINDDDIKEILLSDDLDASDEYLKDITDKIIDEDNRYTFIVNNLIKNVNDFSKLYCSDKFISIFEKPSIDLITYIINNRILDKKNEQCKDDKDNITIEEKINKWKCIAPELVSEAIKINNKIRTKYGIQCNIENLYNIYDNYVAPIVDKLISIDETMDIVNSSFGSTELPDDMFNNNDDDMM